MLFSSPRRISQLKLLLLSILLAIPNAHADLTGRVVAVTDDDNINVLDARYDTQNHKKFTLATDIQV